MRALAVIVVVALLSTRSIAASGNGAIRCSVETNVDLASTPLTVYGIPGSRVILRSANRVDYHLLWAVKRGDETADEEIYEKGYKSTELAVSANYRLVIKSFSSFPDGLRARFRLYRLTNESSHFVYLSQWAVVRVGSRPQIRGNINNMTLNEGEVIPAVCANYSGIPEIDIHVTRRKRGFSESESVDSSRYSYDHQTGCVTFGKASRYDSGEYVILASNCLGQDQLEFSVNVRSKPIVEGLGTQQLHAAFHSNLIIPYIVSGFPAPTITWYHNGTTIHRSSRVFYNTTILMLKTLSKSDEGVYEMRAVNALGRVNRMISIVVTAAARPMTGNPRGSNTPRVRTVTPTARSLSNTTASPLAGHSNNNDIKPWILIVIIIAVILIITIIIIIVILVCYRKRQKYTGKSTKTNSNRVPSRIDTESNKKQVVELRAIKSTDEQPHTANETSKMRKPPPPPKPKSVSVGVIQMKKDNRNSSTAGTGQFTS